MLVQQNESSKTIRNVIINVAITFVIVLIVIHFNRKLNPPPPPPAYIPTPIAEKISADVNTRTKVINYDIQQSKLNQLTATASEVATIAETKEDSANSVVTCPMYVMPDFTSVPQLPPKEIMVKATKDQLIYILYQNIKDHQERIIKNRKRLYETYNEYLKQCK